MWVSDEEIFMFGFLFRFLFYDVNKFWEIGFCRYEFQMQYGSIGWSVGATLGYAQAAQNKRVIACIGDGSFQVDPQMLSSTYSVKALRGVI